MIKKIAIYLMMIAAWQIAGATGLLNAQMFATPLLIIRAVQKDGWVFLMALRITLGEILGAGALAWGLGLICGLALGATRRGVLSMAPVLSAAIAVPLVVLYPVIVAWTGIGPQSKIIYGAAAGFFPITAATMAGMSGIDQRYIMMARAMGAGRLSLLINVMARLALPSIMSGLRIGTSLLIIAVVQSEMLSSSDGLGFWISYHRSLFNVGNVYFGVGLVLLMAAGFNALLARAEAHLRYHIS
jgi:NitT/TauT family transport system permease protein/taurine transport system permease protein